MSLTGLTWSFGWYRTGFYKVFGVETTQGASHHGALSQTTEKEKGHRGEKNERGDAGNPNRKEGKEDDREGRRKSNGEQSPYTSWQGVYEQLKAQNPGYRQITVSNGTATVSFNRLGNQRKDTRMDILCTRRQLGRYAHPYPEFYRGIGRRYIAVDGILSVDKKGNGTVGKEKETIKKQRRMKCNRP